MYNEPYFCNFSDSYVMLREEFPEWHGEPGITKRYYFIVKMLQGERPIQRAENGWREVILDGPLNSGAAIRAMNLRASGPDTSKGD
jgi:hypothetical protein